MECNFFCCCGGECEVARLGGRRGIKVKDSSEAHQAIIKRLGGDLRCERYCTQMLMHIDQSCPLPLTLLHTNTKPCNLVGI